MAQEVAKLGHTAKLIAPHLVRPYVKSNKNDFADAEAICEAATRPTMRFVPPKNQAQQALAMLNSTRDAFIKDRTATVNRSHAALLEVGISLARGFKSINDLPAQLEASSFSESIKRNLMRLSALSERLTTVVFISMSSRSQIHFRDGTVLPRVDGQLETHRNFDGNYCREAEI